MKTSIEATKLWHDNHQEHIQESVNHIAKGLLEIKKELRRLKDTTLKKDNELEKWKIKSAKTTIKLPSIEEQLKFLIGN